MPRFHHYLSLLLLTIVASPSLASPSLEHLQLTRGRSRHLEPPDYYLKLVEAITLNSGYDDSHLSTARQLLARQGVVSLPSAEMYALDAQVRGLLDPYLEHYFPGQMPNYNLVFSDSKDNAASILIGQSTSTVPTLFIGRLLMEKIKYEEELIGVVLHELGHALRARMVKNEPWFDRVLKQMPEEALVDAFATRMLIEMGRNPLGYSLLMEKLLHSETKSKGELRDGALSHPPTESRLTHINSIIERASEIKSFPPLTLLSGPLEKVKSTPPLERNIADVQFETATAQSFGDAIQGLAKGWDSKPSEGVLPLLHKEFEIILDRLNRKSASDWQIDEAWSNAADGLHKFWRSSPLKSNPRVIEFFYALETQLKQKARSLGQTFTSTNDRQVQLFKEFQQIETQDQLLRWSQSFAAPQKIPYQRWTNSLKQYGEHLVYGVYKDPELFAASFEHYIALVPKLYAWTNETLAQGSLADANSSSARRLEAIQKTRDVMIADLFGWTNLAYDRPGIKALMTPDPRGDYLSHERAPEAGAQIFAGWDKLIAELPVPDYARMAFCPAIPVKHEFQWGSYPEQRSYLRDYLHISGLRGQPIFPSSLGFVISPSSESNQFADFQRAMDFLATMQPNGPLEFSNGDRHRLTRLPIQFDDASKWLLATIPKLRFTADDAMVLLSDNKYWEKWNPRNKKEVRSRLKQMTNDFFLWSDAFVERIKTRQRRQVDQEIDTAVDDFFDRSFYRRPEYQLDPQYAEAMQTTIYASLKTNNALPAELTQEIDLWIRVAKRGVTTFTDEWADRIISQFEQLENHTPEQVAAIQSMYFSNLVWSLKAREKLALFVYSPDHSPRVRELRDETSTAVAPSWLDRARNLFEGGRLKRIRAIVREITHEFPENSQERLLVVDRLAERIRATPSETSQMMKDIDHEDRDLAEFDLTRKQAFGLRFYAQLFGEIKASTIDQRLALLDFFLGKTDEVPALIRPKNRHDTDTDEEKREPLLYQVRRNLPPYRIRTQFQALSVEAKTMVLDPLFLGSGGIIEDPIGREWIINTLVPSGATWRDMAVALVDGYREALHQFGQGHLKTMFVSYLVASSARPVRRTDYSEIFANGETAPRQESNLGVMLRSLFSANAALQKIGQRVHSSNVLSGEVNQSIESLKESASRVLREDQFAWLNSASDCDDICKIVQIQEELGNASVKIVLNANINGADSILYLIKPNALRRGEVFFQMIEYAVQYAIDRGHADLRLIQGMIRRAKQTFNRETDLNIERQSAAQLSAVYKLGPSYGRGYQFTTPEFLDTQNLLQTNLAAAVKKVQVKRFSELSADEKREFAQAVNEKEAEIHQFKTSGQSEGVVHFDKDRHEGNYLLVTDADLLAKVGVKKLILTIDFAQASEIAKPVQEALLNAVAVIAGMQSKMLSPSAAAQRLTSVLNAALLKADSRRVTEERVEANLSTAAEVSGAGLKPGEMLARFLSYLEAEGPEIQDEVWDYLTAISTMQTWEKYGNQNAFSNGLKGNVMVRCAALLMGSGNQR